ncbi:magnesium transporter [Thiohalomonas denitrificans]|uniref:Magnesium transporter MgtE n=1 Tax=Thiohalomonas denitrificans TaxID=415747 RepID=A0A1G5PMG6_9GAMM|nr:magnesium transporter [Thiohalomonas denitrificans]SCZ50658.1 magnesium transporter [Thiohalomonas denitrificans]
MTEAIEKEKTPDRLQSFHGFLSTGDTEGMREALADMHPAEIAVLLESLPTDQRLQAWKEVPSEQTGEVLAQVHDKVRLTLIGTMDSDELIAATENLDTDDLADLLPDMPDEVIQQLLNTMDEQNRERLETVLPYPEDSAGGLMNVDTITVRADITLDVVLRYLRRRGEIPETTDNLVVVNRTGHYLGLLPITELLTNKPDQSVAEVMQRGVEPISADTEAHEVARIFEHRDLVTAPVVDADGRLVGRITIDDVVDVIRERADHSFMGMAGLTEEEDIFAPVITSSRRRAVWLGVNLMTAFLAAWVIGLFGATIEQLVALAVLMPIVASMGGIAGSQTLTLVIRAQALGQIGASNARQLLLKELTVGFLNGLVWATVIAVVAGLWFDSVWLGAIIAIAIMINLVVAALSGTVIPLVLKKLGADPALAGGVVLTTVTDVVGFFAFLGLATLFLV